MTSWLYLMAAIRSGSVRHHMHETFPRMDKALASVGVAIFYLLSLGGLTLVLRQIDMGITYAVWAGIGTALSRSWESSISTSPSTR